MNTTALLERMFAVHGKRPLEAQFNEYLNIFDKLGYEKSHKVFEHVRDNEERFPTIRSLWGIIKSLGLLGKRVIKEYEDCYYCQGVGYVPYLVSPKTHIKATGYQLINYACKCSAGQDLPSTLPKYFEVFDSPQFEAEEDLMYPQLVSSKQFEFTEKRRKLDGE